MHLHLNPIGGLAGDMFCAALLDLRPELFDDLKQALQALNPPPDLSIELTQAPGNLHGQRFHVHLPDAKDQESHNHTHYRQIQTLLDEATLELGVRERAQSIFLALAKAESRVHGIELERVVFHEVGNWDSIIDIFAAAFLLEKLQVTSCSCEPLPKGSGRVFTKHGWLPVPAPATAYLLEGIPITDDGIEGERVTPTGAAILKYLKPQVTSSSGHLTGTGYGFGSRQLQGVPNCVQAQLIDTESVTGYQSDRMMEIVFDLDDQSPEDLATGLERIRELPGVASLLLFEAIGKQGRPSQQVQILAETASYQQVVASCFRETRTIGLRYRETRRWTLQRRELKVELPEGEISVKLCLSPDGWRAKAENRDLSLFEGQNNRQRIAHQAEQLALQHIEDEDADD